VAWLFVVACNQTYNENQEQKSKAEVFEKLSACPSKKQT
jgi:hypothetical protein